MELLEQIKENAKKQCKTIVLPEGTEERTIQAADQIIGEGIAKIILIGNPAEIQALAQKHRQSYRYRSGITCQKRTICRFIGRAA